MNLNLLSYSLYLPLSSVIIVWLGKILHRTGFHYVLDMTDHNYPLSTSINNSLLVGYYLVNLGYAVTSLLHWKTINSYTWLLIELVDKTGWLMCTIGIMHYLNILALKIFRTRHQSKGIGDPVKPI